jgi:hypothetical protein
MAREPHHVSLARQGFHCVLPEQVTSSGLVLLGFVSVVIVTVIVLVLVVIHVHIRVRVYPGTGGDGCVGSYP